MPISSEYIARIVRQLPHEPGVYRYYNTAKEIIYIGKAKDLKKRVSSYFSKNHRQDQKTYRLVKEIADIQYTVVNTEFDALLLENNLIKKSQPKYNILLKDGKSYPYICVTRECFPQVFSTREVSNKQHKYYGPYANISIMHALLALFKRLYTLRTCKYNLSERYIVQKKYKVCLEYHIKNCQGPCEGLQKEQDYQVAIDQIEHLLKGNVAVAKQYFKEKMTEAAQSMAYELAAEMKQKYELLCRFQHKSTIVNPNISNIEVYTAANSDQQTYINFMKITNGAIIQTETVQVMQKLHESVEDILLYVILNLREKYGDPAPKIISNVDFSISLLGIAFSVPKIGDLKKLVDLSLKNALFFKRDKEREKLERKNARNKSHALLQLKADLNLPVLPRHMECFDNSNMQGTNPVAAVVCFRDGKPAKSEYRKFHIKTVVGPDDFSSMYEIVTRRYKRLIEEGKCLPNLVVIDGGKGQLSAACRALKDLNIYGKMSVVGIAKRLEEIYFPNDQLPLHISKKSQSLTLLQRARDEAHRFAITFHRNRRSNNSLKTSLEDIPGIGRTTIEKLLRTFKSVTAIKKVPLKELSEVVGKKRAEAVLAFYKKI